MDGSQKKGWFFPGADPKSWRGVRNGWNGLISCVLSHNLNLTLKP